MRMQNNSRHNAACAGLQGAPRTGNTAAAGCCQVLPIGNSCSRHRLQLALCLHPTSPALTLPCPTHACRTRDHHGMHMVLQSPVPVHAMHLAQLWPAQAAL
jgi:hypothetical protein